MFPRFTEKHHKDATEAALLDAAYHQWMSILDSYPDHDPVPANSEEMPPHDVDEPPTGGASAVEFPAPYSPPDSTEVVRLNEAFQ